MITSLAYLGLNSPRADEWPAWHRASGGPW